MNDQKKRAWAIALLREKYKELGKLPTKADFSDGDRCRIKAWLGPWPRALEAAQLKPVAPRYLRRQEKRSRSGQAAEAVSSRKP